MATDDAVKRAETGLRIAQFCIEQELSKSQDKLPAVSAVEKASTKAFCANLSSVVDGTDPSKIQVFFNYRRREYLFDEEPTNIDM